MTTELDWPIAGQIEPITSSSQLSSGCPGVRITTCVVKIWYLIDLLITMDLISSDDISAVLVKGCNGVRVAISAVDYSDVTLYVKSDALYSEMCAWLDQNDLNWPSDLSVMLDLNLNHNSEK